MNFFCLESHILSFPKVVQIPPESPCICMCMFVSDFFFACRSVLALSCGPDRVGFFRYFFMRTCCVGRKLSFNLLTPNDGYSDRTEPLTSERSILYIYSTNTGTEYFKRGIYSPFFPLQNAVCFINLTYLVPVLFTFYIQGVLKLKK